MAFETVEYTEEMGEVNWQEGFEQELAGKTVEQQAHCYGWSVDFLVGGSDASYSTIPQLCEETERYREHLEQLDPEYNKLIVKDGLVVGVTAPKYTYDGHTWVKTDRYLLPYKRYVYDSTSDNNGAGYKERDWYKYLICLPADHKLW